jgi:Domain of unknown function (DUF222)/HNH endonuclease
MIIALGGSSSDVDSAGGMMQQSMETGRTSVAIELERLGDEIAELASHLHAGTYRLLARLREFDQREGWGGGFRSCAHWLSWRTRIGPGAAREKVRVARALGELPLVSEAMRRGELSYAIVRALTRIATAGNEARLLEVAQHATAAQVETFVRAWRRVDRLEEQAEVEKRHRNRHLTLYADDDGTYVVRGRLEPEVGALLERALEVAGLALLRGHNGPGGDVATEPLEPATAAQRRADAIGLVAECALASGVIPVAALPMDSGAAARGSRASGTAESDPEDGMTAASDHADGMTAESDREDQFTAERGASESGTAASTGAAECASDSRIVEMRPAAGCADGPAEGGTAEERPLRARALTVGRSDRFQIVVHVDGAALAAGSESGQAVLASSGVRVSAETSRRLACDAGRVAMVHDARGNVLDVGRRTRTVPPAIRRALDQRDRGCRFPACGLRFCDAHHIAHWADGGATRLDNLLLLCRFHHRLVHEGGCRVELTTAGEVRFRLPDGRLLPAVPAPKRLSADPVATLSSAHRAAGIRIDDWTATSDWRGDALDVDWAVLLLRTQGNQPQPCQARRARGGGV